MDESTEEGKGIENSAENSASSAHHKTQRKRSRHRKKLLHDMIRKQIEFYFSTANLSKDRYMQKLLQGQQEVPLEEFLKFNKVRSLSEDLGELRKALKDSEHLKLTEDLTKVYRAIPFTPRSKEDEEESTIYVENLPTTASHDWIVSSFSEFGTVNYVSLPKFKKTGQIKGFAFIEFDSPESANKALEAYRSTGSCIPMETDPSSLRSINTFNAEEAGEQEEARPVAAEADEEENGTRKRKVVAEEASEGVAEGSATKKTKVEEKSESDEKSQDETKEPDGAAKSAKKKRKRKKIHKAEEQEVQALALRVLSKKDWKRLRNKYLNMQRESMRQAKNAYRHRQYVSAEGEKPGKPIPEPVSVPEEKKETGQNEDFVTGVIVKLVLDEPISDAKRFKGQVRVQEGVSYVDADENTNVAFVRCTGPEAAQHLLAQKIWPKATILEGEEETEYWEKIRQNREKKRHTNQRPKQRGKDKWKRKMQKASGAKNNLHIHFDE